MTCRRYFDDAFLTTVFGDADIVAELKSIYPAELEKPKDVILSLLEDGIDESNAEELFEAAHKLKGASGAVCSYTLEAMAEAVCKAYTIRNYNAMDFCATRLYEDIMAALKCLQ